MSWQRYDEPVELLQKRFQYFPQAFRWRGRYFMVASVERCWSVSGRGWRQPVGRHYFRLRCTEGSFELYQDLAANTWHVGRAALGATSRAPLGQLSHA